MVGVQKARDIINYWGR